MTQAPESTINRYYDPTTDEFISIDPEAATTNQPYVFTNDDPLNAEDPLGLDENTMGSDTDMWGDPGVVPTVSGGAAEPDNPGEPMKIGADGPKFSSITLTSNEYFRIDVENPDPGIRDGQIHLQTYSGAKYQYNFETGSFEGVSNKFARQLAVNPRVARAIATGLKYLGGKG